MPPPTTSPLTNRNAKRSDPIRRSVGSNCHGCWHSACCLAWFWCFQYAAGLLKWQDASARASQTAGIESIAAAKDSTIAMLSYQPDSVEKDLGAAQDRLTGNFKTAYAQLIHDVVIPGAKQQHISAVATIPAAAPVAANPKHAVVLLFVDQTVITGTDAPTDTASTVRVSLDKIGNRWLISSFDPI